MKKSTRFCTALCCFLLALSGWAGVPFATTTIVDGEFAAGTKWYTMRISSAGLYLSDNGSAQFISLESNKTTRADADLWCFVGSDAEGYRIYNRQAGTGKVLASPAAMSGQEGETAYVILKDAANLGTYKDVWSFSDSPDLTDGQYMSQKGSSANYVNNRQGKLAFWTGGKDQGSALVIEFAKAVIPVSASTGTFTANGQSSYYYLWTSAATAPGVTLNSGGANNMNKAGDGIGAYVGSRGTSCTYTLSTDQGYAVTGFSFDFANAAAGKSITVTAGETTLTSSDTKQSISLSDIEDGNASFVLGGSNYGVVLTDFYVTVTKTDVVKPQFDVFPTLTTAAIPYRIPAIAKAHNGDLVAVADYRWNRRDIGQGGDYDGRIDLHARISKDNGATWGDIFTIIEGQGNKSDVFHTGFGDPCIVADRESDKVFLLSCSGNVSFPYGTRDNHQGIAIFYSHDNGATWDAPYDIAESVYSLFDKCDRGPIRSMFIGSGKIHQSRYTKVGDYYRLYCAALVKDVNGTNCNYILYSDDFGKSWKVLGDPNDCPIPSGGDEPKAEELPDGSMVISSRISGGRAYNIFSFTDSRKAEGKWGTMANSNSSNNGTVATGNSCNGEIMVVPVVRKADGKKLYLALQSVPFGSGRSNVGIYYKALDNLDDFNTPVNFARDWDGRHQVSRIGSAYSTMITQANDSIGFLYEEETYCNTSGGGYNIVYKAYSIEELTDSLYSYDRSADNEAYNKVNVSPFVKEKIAALYDTETAYVGQPDPTGREAVEAAYAVYQGAPTNANYEAVNKSLFEAPVIGIEAGKYYTLESKLYPGKFMTPSGTAYRGLARAAGDDGQLFSFQAAGDGNWKVYNEKAKTWVSNTIAQYQNVPQVSAESEAGTFSIVSDLYGVSYLKSLKPVDGSKPALHLDGGGNIVSWETGSDGSHWYIARVELPVAVDQAVAEQSQAVNAYYDLSGRRVPMPAKGIYVTDRGKKVLKK